MPPLRSADLHRAARQELGPTLGALGFRRATSSTASWVRPDGDRWLVLWLQPSRSPSRGNNAFEFTIELRRSSRPETGGDGPRRRLPTLLTSPQREKLLNARRLVAHGADDAWFRQTSEADARALLASLAEVLPAAIDRFPAA
jgi:hypothetical protein